MSKKAKWIIAVISAVVILIVGFAITKAVIANIEEKKAQEEYEKEQARLQQWYDFDCDMAEIVSNYDFTGTLEENLEEWDAFGVEMEKYMDDQIEAGIIEDYNEGFCSYHISFKDSFNILLQPPFEIEGIMGGGSGLAPAVSTDFAKPYLVAENNTEQNIGSYIKKGEGKVLTIEPVSDKEEATDSLDIASSYFFSPPFYYSHDAYKQEDCNDINKLMEAFTSWSEYDVIMIESHGEYIKDKNENYLFTSLQIAENVDYLSFRKYIKNSPYFQNWDDFTFGIKAYSEGNWRRATEAEALSTEKYHIQSTDWMKSETGMSEESYYALKEEERLTGKTIDWIPQNIKLLVNSNWLENVYSINPLNNRPIIYLSNCFAGQDDAIANALMNNGAKAVMCYYNATEIPYHADMVEYIMKVLTANDNDELNTLEYAIDEAKKLYGEKCTRKSTVVHLLRSKLRRSPDAYDSKEEQCYLRYFASEDDIRLPIYKYDNITDDEYYSSGLDVPQDMPEKQEKPEEDEEINVVPVYIENEDDAKLWETISAKYPTPETLEAGDEYVILGWCYSLGVGVEQDKQKAIECYVKAVDMGSYKGAQELVWCYLNGDGAIPDWKLAVNWYDKYETMRSDRQSSLMKEYQVGDSAAISQYMDTLRAVQLEWLETVAEDTQNIDVMMRIYELWDCYDICQVTEETALAWLQKAADMEHPKAIALLATYYSNGSNVIQRDDAKALELMTKAVKAGETSQILAMVWPAIELKNNDFVAMCLDLANQNDPNAVCFMALYYQGIGDHWDTPEEERQSYYDAAHDYDVKGKELGVVQCAWNLAYDQWGINDNNFLDALPYYEAACEMDPRWYADLAVLGHGRTYDGISEEKYYEYLNLAAEAGNHYAMNKVLETLSGDEYWEYYKYVAQVGNTYRYTKTDNVNR